MLFLEFLYPSFLALLAISSLSAAAKSRPKNAVLLSNVKTLTLRANTKTSHRRVSAIPQLKCIGGSGRGLYEIDVMRCTNQGSDYDDENIQWSCTANLPAEFKLGSTDVICEGYDSPTDPYILKGSCGVEYRLLLTDKGEEKYGKGGRSLFGGDDSEGTWASILFLIAFVAIAGWIIYSMCYAVRNPTTRRPPRVGGGGGGWGGGGGGPGGDPYDPPPPYPGKRYSETRQEGWRPGFWTGAVSGAAAGYMAGNQRRNNQADPWQSGSSWGGGPASRYGSSSSSSSGSGSSRHESTGFGSTSRR
ncbi:transmembrane protein-like protein 66 [Xylogone sp. PMI_703]|nr:transmembrane protein-like protein 66 [Xylogone sp. PMI_703]